MKVERFIGDFVFQADAVRRGKRAAERLDVIGQAEYEVAHVSRDELAEGAVVVRVPNEAGRLDTFSFAGWNGALWSPLGDSRNEFPAKPTLSLLDYRAGFGALWIHDGARTHRTDPLRRVYDYRLAPPRHRGLLSLFPQDRTTVRQDDIKPDPAWSNRTEALARHLAAASDLLAVDGMMYVRRPDPIWAVDKSVRLTLPKFWISSDMDVMPATHDGHHLMNLEAHRVDRADRVMRAGPARGEVLALDASFLSRDDAAWALFCRLSPIVERTEQLLRYLPATAGAAHGRVAGLFDACSMWNLAPLSAAKDNVVADLKRIAADARSSGIPARLLRTRDIGVGWIESALRQYARHPEPGLCAEDEAGLATLAAGGPR